MSVLSFSFSTIDDFWWLRSSLIMPILYSDDFSSISFDNFSTIPARRSINSELFFAPSSAIFCAITSGLASIRLIAALFISFCHDIILSLISLKAISALLACLDAKYQNRMAKIKLIMDVTVPNTFKSILFPFVYNVNICGLSAVCFCWGQIPLTK